MNNIDYKKIVPYIVTILLFIGISLAYFYPQLQGLELATHDQKQWKGGAQEINKVFLENDRIALWSDSMFGGMPAYFVGMFYTHNYIARYISPMITLGLDRPAVYIFWSLVSFFLLTQVLNIKIPIGISGSIGYAFTSYNFVVLAAGHFAKVMALGFMPGILAGALLIRDKKYLLGVSVTALFMSLEMMVNHPQMTYYFFVFFIVIYFILAFFEDLKKGNFKGYITAAVCFGIAVIIGVLPSAAQILTTQEYAPYSIRGKSELTTGLDSSDKTEGLDRSYITNWSGGVSETWALLIPHAKGPGSGPLATHKIALEAVDRQFKKPMESIDSYWGDQPFIGGPMYAGAIMVFLAVLAILTVSGTLKWALVIGSVISLLLSWGKNFPSLTNVFIDYFPLYNKFRAVVSIEIVALFAIPVLAVLVLKNIFQDTDFLSKPLVIFGKKTSWNNRMAIYIAYGLTGGLSFVFWLMPTVFFDFFKSGEELNYVNSLKSSGWQISQIYDLIDNIEAARVALFRSDALRSFIFITLAGSMLFAYVKNKMKATTVLYIIAALVLIDMWGVNTRYMDVKKSFDRKRDVQVPFTKSVADQSILDDTSPDKRVLNISTSTFNETGTSYFHHSIGGYNGAKMKKYQELIERYISSEIQLFRGSMQQVKTDDDLAAIFAQTPILNMLNTKYVIYNPKAPALLNPKAQGGAWFVDDIKWVETADQEIDALSEIDLRTTAVIRNDQREIISNVGDRNGFIRLKNNDLDRLVYVSESETDQVAILSEIWYPKGWIAKIDGIEVPIGRANYLLRSLSIPAGSHEIELVFAPRSYFIGEQIALVGSIILFALLLGSIYVGLIRKNKNA